MIRTVLLCLGMLLIGTSWVNAQSREEKVRNDRKKFEAEGFGPKLNYEGQVVQSCIHCHQIGDAQRKLYRTRKEAIPEQVLFPYPHPRTLGLIMDPRERATVLPVEEKSMAAEAGFRRGDVIVRLEGQPLLSIADIQWVLHRASAEGASLNAEVQRGNRLEKLMLTLPPGWRRRDDISWRASTWGLRAMATGGMLLETLPPEERKNAGLGEKAMALRVKWPGGGNGPHGAALRAGFRRGDVLVAFDGREDLVRETDLIAHALRKRRPGETVSVSVLRDGKRVHLKLPMQE